MCDRGGGHPVKRLGRGYRFFPEFAPVEVVAEQAVRAEVGEHAVAAYQRRRGGGVAGLVHFFEFNLGRHFLPKNLSVGPVQRERDEPALGQAGEENALGRQNRRGKTGADFGLPSEVVAGRLDRWLAVPGQAGAVGAPVLVPLGAKRLAKREGEQEGREKNGSNHRLRKSETNSPGSASAKRAPLALHRLAKRWARFLIS